MANKKASKSNEAYFARYKTNNVHAKNRARKLQKLQKEQPNNTQIDAALKDIRYKRRTPKAEVWSHSMIATAKLFKLFTGKVDKGLFHPDPLVQTAATKTRKAAIFDNYKAPVLNQNTMFSIKERAHSNGVRAWI
jgi:hypothetical protein